MRRNDKPVIGDMAVSNVAECKASSAIRRRLNGKQIPLIEQHHSLELDTRGMFSIKVIKSGRVIGINSRRRLIGKQKLPQQPTEDRTETELSKNDGIWPELEKIDELLELDTGGVLATRLTTKQTTRK